MTPLQRDCPKIELHVHVEGTARPPTLGRIATRNGLDVPPRRPFTDLYEFIASYSEVAARLREPRDYRDLILAYAAEAATGGAVYIEAIVCATDERMGGAAGWADILAVSCDAADEASERFDLEFNLTPEVYRGCDPEFATAATKAVTAIDHPRIVGFGLSGFEGREPATPYLNAARIAVDAGLGFVPHAGEAAGPPSIREVLALRPPRIRHGVRAIEDPELVAELAETGTVLDVTLTSNLLLGVTTDLASHPLPLLRNAGVACSISTDDPALFDTDLPREYDLAATLGTTPPEAFAAGLSGALCSAAVKARLASISRAAFRRGSEPSER
ncbi:adenosine deaminase family protein [Stackebrandtia nassauensis]|uniref:Adenosine deaminase n=1 Tax=Stackebrandtia nassauensis (strain DSM 44728 / CIP 108903 / NRRL B-16338 / NBRC 102104 / LLR-40K-21) TaxID=446470 RepID=D3Q102_STANL|nr:adenosine deaminase family protein [Stackebrandtia nassauensis]ADD43752.1 Adenosine deaminase [Stackebrandtia nassauensis DSM 44728]